MYAVHKHFVSCSKQFEQQSLTVREERSVWQQSVQGYIST